MLKRVLCGLVCGVVLSGANADNALLQRKSVQHFIHYMVSHDGYNRAELIAAIKAAQRQPKIIEAMDRPYEQKSWDVYRAIFLTPQRVKAGVAFWKANAATLARAEREYGVPADVIVSILGVETMYGERQGGFRVLDALTTLAFDYPKRAPYFTRELREYLLLCREHHVSPTYYVGSYAGAIGKPQFMPSNYRIYAVDYANHGKRDLIADDRDVIGSVANFFQKHGWTPNQPVAQPVRWSPTLKQQPIVTEKQANYSYQQLLSYGVRPITPMPHHPNRAGVIELTTENGASYWLAYPNFYAITRYNSSPQYALAVYLLAQQIRQQMRG